MDELSKSTRANTTGVLKKLADDLSAALPDRAISILTRDKQTGSYRGRLTDRYGGGYGVNLDATNPAIRALLEGQARAEWGGGQSIGSSSGHHPGAYVFPVSARGHIEHVLVISGGYLTASDSRLIEGYCRETALALENIHMYSSLARKIERLSYLAGMADDLSVEQSYRHLLQTVLDRSAELLLAEQGSIMLIEKETDTLLLEVSKGALKQSAQPVRVLKGVGIAGKVAEMGEPILVEDVEHDPRIGKKSRTRYKTPSFVSVPLKMGSRVVGVMNLTDKATGEFFDDVDLRLAQTCASHAAIILDRKEMHDQTEKLKQQAITDHLTGLWNRGCVLGRLREELFRSKRYAKLMSLVMLDIDGFKNVNDMYGHAAGDRVLRKISDVMMKSVRAIDIVGRYGGDEFVIILPETDAYFAVHMAERVRADIANTDLAQEIPGHAVSRLTASIGIATFPVHGTNWDVLVDHADEALYRAKTAGKNRVSVY